VSEENLRLYGRDSYLYPLHALYVLTDRGASCPAQHFERELLSFVLVVR
jgi:hypothetical protein